MSTPARSRLQFDVRPVDGDDIEALVAIERRCYTLPWSRAMFDGEIAKEDDGALAAIDARDGRVLGYLIASRYADVWHVMNVAVDPDVRRGGIARALLERLFEVARGNDAQGYTLEVRVSNDAAIALYRSLGFRGRGIRPGYYIDNREDAVVMWRPPQSVVPTGPGAADAAAAATWEPQ